MLFNFVYSFFGHGVTSDAMTYMFAYPLICGALPFAVFTLIPFNVTRSRFSYNVYNSGIATVTLGSCVQGVLEIAGGDSELLVCFYIVGIFFTCLGIVSWIFTLARSVAAKIKR